ncbi:efflux RND transporter periplasmic adaptor subunit [Granulicella mallensis]|uniref:Efflux transporter, RND family, MFP subunit n=1 Tax=Granulicella mallensis (strain ATCC BAA-1857 / DSM 23137 / MP5ACTX8) TaxID=682795 RepID=G8NQL5_GRAMM|nr:efflux RND transporter periplasmic adaptor subunit [Granulicella mallensis]AEU37241.1 efflux transporter, RND family, MFP subunit [Granulicella mallensis MP5ACTX8]
MLLRSRNFIGFGVVLFCLSTAGCKKTDPTPEVAVSVEAAKPETGPISEQITSDAILAPLAQAALSPKISAPVREFYVQRGAHVHVGQLLVSLEDRDLAATALDNRGSYTAAEAAYDQTTKAQMPEDTQKAELDLAQAKANLDLNRSIVSGRRQLLKEGAIPGRDLDTAEAALVQAQAAYDSAAKHLQSVQSVSHAAAGKSAEGQLTSAKGKFQNAEAQLSYASLRSPIDGVVTDRPLFAGETAQAGTPLITVMDTSSLLAKVHLSQAAAQRMKVGDKAQVTIPGMDEPVEATVSLISPALDPGSTTVEVWVKLKNPDGKLKAGTPVHLAIAGRTVPDALQIPTQALVPAKDGSLGVMVISDGAAHLKPVQIGIRLPDKVQITSGISASDMVITSGGYGLDDNTKVTTAKAEGAAGDKD